MESTLSPPTVALLTFSKTLKFHSSSSSPIVTPSIAHLYRPLSTTTPLLTYCLLRSRGFSTRPLCSALCKTDAFASIRYLCAAVPLVRFRLACVSNSAASFATSGGTGGGNGDFSGGSGGGGSGRPEGGDPKAVNVSGAGEDVSTLSPDVIILDVGGMTCGGCAASVKRILESQPHVSSASVNLTTETAVVWPLSEAKAVPNWQKQLGEMLAEHLTNCGFKSNLRGQGAKEGDIS